MRTLVLMRHAKTEPSHVQGDKARRLTDRGRSDAASAGRAMSGCAIERVLSSSSVRTRQTVESLDLEAPVEFLDELYNAGVDEVVRVIGEADDEVTSLLVVGHSPSMPWLASQLAAEHDPAEAASIGEWFPTAAWVQFEVDGDWTDLARTLSARVVGVHRISEGG